MSAVIQKRRKKILHVISSGVMGGAEKCFLEMIDGLKGYGYDIAAVCAPGGELFDLTKKLCDEVYEIKFLDNADVFALWRLISVMKNSHFDICHLHMNRATLIGGAAAKMCGVKSVGTIQGEVKPIYGYFPDYLTYCSRNVAEFIRTRSHKVAQKPCFFLYNKIDTETVIKNSAGAGREFLKKEFNIPENAFVICEVARLHPNKGQKFLIEAVSILKDKIPDIYCLIVGDGDRNYAEELKNVARQNKIADRVIFTGLRLDAARIFKSSDLFVLPSLQEGIPVTVMEALCLQVPVAAFNVGGIHELCETDAGYQNFIEFVNCGNVEGLSERIETIYRNYDNYKAKAAAASEHIVKNFDSKSYIKEIDAIYKNILGDNK
ncbi:MAG: glycosyltransferase [Candidatus Wallbacteria bacterium]